MTSDLLERYPAFILRRRWLVLTCATLVMLVLAAGAGSVKVANNYRILFNEDDPRLIAFDRLEETYTKSNAALIAIAPKNGKVFTREILGAIEDLTEAAWKTPHSNRVDSLTNYIHSRAKGDELIVEPLVENAGALNDANLARIRKTALEESDIAGSLISANGKTAGLIIDFVLPEKPETAIVEITDYLDALLDRQQANHPDIEYFATGNVFVERAFGDATASDIENLLPIAFLVIFLLAIILLRSVFGTFSVLVVVLFSVGSAMGFVGWTGMVLSPPNAGIPLIVLTIAIADSIHIVTAVLQGMRRGLTKDAAITEAVRVNLSPVFVTSLTTAIGFMSLNASDAPPFHILGNSVAFGVLCALFFSITLLPALLAILPMRARAAQSRESSFFDRFGEFVIAKRQILLWSTLLIVIGLMSGILRIELGDNLTKYFDESYKIRRDSDFIAKNLTGLDKLEYSLNSGRDGGITDPAYLRKVDAFAEWFRKQPKVAHVQAFSDTMKRLNKNMNGDDPTFYKVPDNPDLAAQFLLLYEFSLPLGRDLNDRIDVGNSATRMAVTISDATSRDLREIDNRAHAWLRANIPDFAQNATGVHAIVAYLTQQNIESMLKGTIIALALISFILILVFRNLKLGFLSLIPNFIPALLTFGLWGYLVGRVGIAGSVIVSIAFGIVVDDTVHFLSKYVKARRDGFVAADAVRYTFRTVGYALWTTTATLAAGFMVFAVSGFEANWVLGVLVTITIMFALAADFLLLPVLLIVFDRKKSLERIAK